MSFFHVSSLRPGGKLAYGRSKRDIVALLPARPPKVGASHPVDLARAEDKSSRRVCGREFFFFYVPVC